MRSTLLFVLAALGLTACRAADPLSFSDFTVEELAGTRALLRFTTNRAVQLEIELGSAEDVLDRHFTDPELVAGMTTTEHRVPLENLFPNTKYFFHAKTKDPETGDTVFSSIQNFRTPVATVSRLTNVALTEAGTKVTSISSALDDAHGPTLALDGDFVTEWVTKGDGDAAKLELDLGQTRHLLGFGFRSRGLSDGTAVITRVGLSLDGATELTFDTPDPRVLYTFTFSAPVDARTAVVRALASTGGNTGAKEVQLLTQ